MALNNVSLETCLDEFQAGKGRAFRLVVPKRSPMIAWVFNLDAGLLESTPPIPSLRQSPSKQVERDFRSALRREARAHVPMKPTLEGLADFLMFSGAKPGDDVRALARLWFRACDETDRRAFRCQLSKHLAAGIARFAPAFAEGSNRG